MPTFRDNQYALGACDLRLLQSGDAGAISDTLVSMDPWQRLGYRGDDLARYLTRLDTGLKRFVVETGSEIGGVLCVRYPWLFGPFIELIAVFNPHRGLGIGKTIIAWIENQVRPTSKNIWTTVSSFNTNAHRFYGSLGFSEVALLEGLINNNFSELLLRKKLSAQAPFNALVHKSI